MQVKDELRIAAIHGGTAAEAITLWLDGAYRAGDEPALLSVIRRETGSDLSDAEIKELVYAAFDDGCDATAVLARLLEAERHESLPHRPLPPR